MLGNSGYPYIGAAEEKNTLYKYLKSISTDEEYAAQYASLHDLILMFGHSNQCRQVGRGYIAGSTLQWRLQSVLQP